MPLYNYHYHCHCDDDDDIVTWEHLEDVSTAGPCSDNDSDKGVSDFENENVPRSSHIEDIADTDVDARRHSGRFRVRRWFGWGRGSGRDESDVGKKRR